MAKKRRISTHDIETRSKDNIRALINADGRGLFRELSERDYGIDAMVEVFDEGNVTGKFAMLQCKGKEAIITPLRTEPNYVSCPGISASNISYLEQDNVLVILVYGSVNDRDNFYFADLKAVITEEQVEVLSEESKRVTVRIPSDNNVKDNMDRFFELIENYYSKYKNK